MRFFTFYSKKNGYVALISALIITGVLLMITLALSLSGFFGRFDTQNLEIKSLSRFVSEGCLETALLKLSAGSYGGNETIAIDNYQCQILPIETSGSSKTIKITSTIQNFTTNLIAVVDAYTLEILSTNEVAVF